MTFFATIKNLQLILSNQREWLMFLENNDNKKVAVTVTRETGVRTGKQNNSIHLWCEQVAKELNESGQSIQEVLKKTIEISWTGDSVKELIWRKIQISLTGKISTTKLDKTEEINNIYEHANRFLGEKCQLHVPFPQQIKDETKIDYQQRDASNTPTF